MGLYPYRRHPARAARVHSLLSFARRSRRTGLLLRRHIQNGALRREPLATLARKCRPVLVPRERAPIEHRRDNGNSPAADPRRIGKRDYVGLVQFYRPHFPDCFKHPNHLISVATLLSVVRVYVTLTHVVKQMARDAVTPRADVQSGVSAMNKPEDTRRRPRPPGLIRAGGLIHDPRHSPGKQTASGEAP